MEIVSSDNGKKLKITRDEWEDLGKQAQWFGNKEVASPDALGIRKVRRLHGTEASKLYGYYPSGMQTETQEERTSSPNDNAEHHTYEKESKESWKNSR